MGKVITFINENGGVGKTSLIFNTAWELSKKGKVVMIDLDGQKGNLTFFAGVEVNDDTNTMVQVLENEATVEESLVEIKKNLFIIPANTEITAMSHTTKIIRMSKLMKDMREQFDYIFIDVNPNPDMRQMLALTSADYLIIPMRPDPKALEGSTGIAESILEAKEFNEGLVVMGMVMNFYDSRTGIGREVLSAMDSRAEKLGGKVFKTRVRQCVALTENVLTHTGITDYAPSSNAANDIRDFVSELRKEIRAHG